MSYCVNCGVELAASEKDCPLCGVEVHNPNDPDRVIAKGLYPRPSPAALKLGFREYLAPLALLLLIPLLICALCDFLTTQTLTWSVYVIGSMTLMYVYLFMPFIIRRNTTRWCILLDTLITILFLLMIENQTGGVWFLPVALPLSITAGLLLIILITIFDRLRPRKLVRFALALFFISAYSVITNIAVRMFNDAISAPSWSLYCVIPCVIIGILSLIVNRNSKLKAEAKRRFFI